MSVQDTLDKYGHFWKANYKEHLECVAGECNIHIDAVYNTAFYLGTAKTVFLLRNIMRGGHG